MSHVTTYLNLKLAHDLFQKQLENLQPEERQRVETVASKQQQLEQLILGSTAAAHVILPETSLEASFNEIRARYTKPEEFATELETIGLTEAGLREAIERDMKVEAILEKIAVQADPISDTDVEIFYLVHKERFRRPEIRVLRHILITINPTLASNERENAQAKISAILERLQKSPERFEEQALKHSECPTAMNGGLLGRVKRGQLFPELEPHAFALETGELSGICESPIGFHLLFCDSSEAESFAPLAQATQQIRDHLEEQRRKQCQKTWIKSLQAAHAR